MNYPHFFSFRQRVAGLIPGMRAAWVWLLAAAARPFDFGGKVSHVAETAVEELIERAEHLIEDHNNAANIGLRGII